jgi:murein DD-endopeptidase MepM/ murein hydrolase activator NlpD
MSTHFKLFPVVIILLSVSGCVSVRDRKDYLATDLPEPDRLGIYHKVKKGETLWRVARAYHVAIDDIIRTNYIPNAAKVEENQLVFIPGAYAPKEVLVEEDDSQNNFIWPLKGTVVGYFHDTNDGRFNKGIDIHAYEGEMVKAARKGRVVFADYLSGYGYTVILGHTDDFYSVYARTARVLVGLNDAVRQGEEIAQIGSVDDLAYLHFEIRKGSMEDNPLYYLP